MLSGDMVDANNTFPRFLLGSLRQNIGMVEDVGNTDPGRRTLKVKNIQIFGRRTFTHIYSGTAHIEFSKEFTEKLS